MWREYLVEWLCGENILLSGVVVWREYLVEWLCGENILLSGCVERISC